MGGETEAKKFTPLGIIALFVSLAEGATVAATTQTTGTIQFGFMIFATTFPFAMLLGFFAILWSKANVLYAPSDYGGMDPEKFAGAIRPQNLDASHSYDSIRKALHGTLRPEEIAEEILKTVEGPTPATKRDIAKLVDARVDKAMEGIRASTFLTIDSRPFLGDTEGKVWQVPYEGFQNPGQLLSAIWQTVGKLPRGNYGRHWALQDVETGKLLLNMGSRWRAAQNIERDDRTLEETGIFPGMTLKVIRLASEDEEESETAMTGKRKRFLRIRR